MIRFPLNTEKTIRLMESQNTLVFVVDKHDTKPQIKEAVEKLFAVKVRGVRTQTSLTGIKRAYVALAAESPAIDVATKMGMI